jgi:hypothetical protein
MENTDKKIKQNDNESQSQKPANLPVDLRDDLKKNKIDPLTEGSTHLGYEERAPRKKELDQKEHFDQDDK